MNAETIKRLIFALVIVGALFGTSLFIAKLGGKDTKEAMKVDIQDSELVSKDPKESAANFIIANGTIGNFEEMSDEELVKGIFKPTFEARAEAFELAKTAIIEDSPIITGTEEEVNYDQDGIFPMYFSIKNLKVSEPYKESKLKIEHNQVGQVEYDSVRVKVDFDSVQTVLFWPTDASLEAVLSVEQATDSFKDVEVELVKVDGLWYIYDVENIEYDLNVRMATWSGRGNYDVSNDVEVVKEYSIDVSEFGQEGL